MSRARVRAPTENRTRAATDDARASGRRDEVFWLGKARKAQKMTFSFRRAFSQLILFFASSRSL
jgi:hypothetical protein